MIHDISPHQYHPEFTPRKPRDDDHVLLFSDKKVLLRRKGDELQVPRYADMGGIVDDLDGKLIYLFSIDEVAFYLVTGENPVPAGDFTLEQPGLFRTFKPLWLAFAGITGSHLNDWYSAHKFCGACGERFTHSEKERALICPGCGCVTYPKIAPVVIVAVTDDERLLLTRYRGRPYSNYALVAGFVEIGESFENAVRREIMEEVGLAVTNIRYYKSQPWAFSGSLIAGFFADVEGDTSITMDQDELSEALWMQRENILQSSLYERNNVSITSEMIGQFCDNTHPR